MDHAIYNPEEIKIFKKLNTPAKAQEFLNKIPINFQDVIRSPRVVLQSNKAQCLEGAMLGAAILEFHGHMPYVLDLRTVAVGDDDHVIALFKVDGYWGALSKTNHAVLRYREPIYKTLRELVLSYFHEYFLHSGKKTLREYSIPINLNKFNVLNWRTSAGDITEISDRIDEVKHFSLLTKQQIKNLRLADEIEIKAGKLVEWKK